MHYPIAATQSLNLGFSSFCSSVQNSIHTNVGGKARMLVLNTLVRSLLAINRSPIHYTHLQLQTKLTLTNDFYFYDQKNKSMRTEKNTQMYKQNQKTTTVNQLLTHTTECCSRFRFGRGKMHLSKFKAHTRRGTWFPIDTLAYV